MSKIYWCWTNIPGSLKRIWQNIIRGWNDSDCWSLSETFADFVLPRLKRYKEMVHGYPSLLNIEDDNYEEGMRQWKEIIDKMIYSFEVISNDYDNVKMEDAGGKLDFVPIQNKDEKYSTIEYIGTEEQKKQHEFDLKQYTKAIKTERKKVNEGLMLFAKYYECLWD